MQHNCNNISISNVHVHLYIHTSVSLKVYWSIYTACHACLLAMCEASTPEHSIHVSTPIKSKCLVPNKI